MPRGTGDAKPGRPKTPPPIDLSELKLVKINDMVGLHGWTQEHLANALHVDITTLQRQLKAELEGRPCPRYQGTCWLILDRQQKKSNQMY
jgi:AraC-like DNA-binding protein